MRPSLVAVVEYVAADVGPLIVTTGGVVSTVVTDHVKVGFTVSDKPPERRYLSFLTSSPTDPKRFAIPPNTPNWESPPAEVTFLQDAELVYLTDPDGVRIELMAGVPDLSRL